MVLLVAMGSVSVIRAACRRSRVQSLQHHIVFHDLSVENQSTQDLTRSLRMKHHSAIFFRLEWCSGWPRHHWCCGCGGIESNFDNRGNIERVAEASQWPSNILKQPVDCRLSCHQDNWPEPDGLLPATLGLLQMNTVTTMCCIVSTSD